MEHFHFYANLKFNWENLIFHLCPNVAIFLKNVFIFKDRTLQKKIILKGRGFRCGSDEKMMRMWFGLEIDVVGLPPLPRLYKYLILYIYLQNTPSSSVNFTLTLLVQTTDTHTWRFSPLFYTCFFSSCKINLTWYNSLNVCAKRQKWQFFSILVSFYIFLIVSISPWLSHIH